MNCSRVLLLSFWQKVSLPFVLLFASLFRTSMASVESCGKPFSMPITNIALTNGAHMRGVQIGIGSSEQILAMVPTLLTNNTLIHDKQGQCDQGFTQAECLTYRGGMFDSSESTSYGVASNMSASGVDPTDTFVNATSDAWSTDTFHFTSNISSEVAFGIRRINTTGQYLTQHILGLGANSTLLNALKEAGIIASRSWSMYWGNSGAPATHSDGVFVFGGYDSTKVKGDNHTFQLTYDTNCTSGMVLSISDISLVFPNGTPASLFTAASDSLKACILPDYPVLMTLRYDSNPDFRDPKQYYQGLLSAANLPEFPETHSVGLNFWGETYPSTYNIDFDIRISIQAGPTVLIANSEVVQPDATILSNGSINYSDTMNELNIIPLLPPNNKDIIQLGRQSLSSAYVMVNQDAGNFVLWQASGGSDENLVAVDESGKPFAPNCSSTAAAPSASNGSSSASSSAPPSTAKPSTPSIVDPVVGSIAGVVLLLGLGIFFWMRKRKNKIVHATENSAFVHHEDRKDIPLYDYAAAERTNSRHELWGNPVNEISGHVTPPEEKNKLPMAASGVHELGESH